MYEVLRLGVAGLGVASTQILPPISTLPFIKITAAADTRIDALAKSGGELMAGVTISTARDPSPVVPE